jgi:CBS domain-containing protein
MDAAAAAALARHAPFAQMAVADVAAFVRDASPVRHAAGATLLAPADGPVEHLWCVLEGSVQGEGGALADADDGSLRHEAGALFPIAAALAARPVNLRYVAQGDTVCLRLPVAAMQALARTSPAFADHLNRGVLRFFERSRRAMQAAYTSQTLLEQALETPLGDLPRKTPVAVGEGASLADALAAMHDHGVGSVLVLDAAGAAQGILTRHDVLGRVALAQRPLGGPVADVMTKPVHTLDARATAQDAVLAMARHGIRHVPVTDARGRVVSIVSERDLFALQRLSLTQVGAAIRAAPDARALVGIAADIRRLASNLLAQGVAARQLTDLITHLNDSLTAQLVRLLAVEHRLDLGRACWLAFGSEGRGEQTIATDQDNGLVFLSDDPARDRPAWLALGHAANLALDAAGYPLCKGGVMAGNPDCCLTPEEWRARFERWMAQGGPQDLLNASIYFDLRAIAGRFELADPLRTFVTERARGLPRFLKQLADNALTHGAPLNWLGRIDGEAIDLKLQGTAIFVDATRLLALAHGIGATGTRQRIAALAQAGHLPSSEADVWIGAFEFLQMLRLRVQSGAGHGGEHPNRLRVADLNEIDRLVLREVLRVARSLQQRLELDYQR